MKNTEFYLKKANDLLDQLQAIDTEQLNTDIRNQSLKGWTNRLEIEIESENLDILSDLEFQIKLLFSSHDKSDLFLERLKHLSVNKFDHNSSENTKVILTKVLKEFSNYITQYEIE